MGNIFGSRDLSIIYGRTWEENYKVFNYIQLMDCNQPLDSQRFWGNVIGKPVTFAEHICEKTSVSGQKTENICVSCKHSTDNWSRGRLE